MALDFDGVNNYAKSGAVFNNDAQMCVFGRFYIPSSYTPSQFDRLFEIGGNATNDGGASLEIDSPTTDIKMVVWVPASKGVGTYAYPTDTWFDVLFTSDTTGPSNKVYFAGGSPSTNTTDTRKTNATELTIAGQNNNPTANNSEISVADFTVWHGVILTQADSDSLASGVSPLMIHPENIVEYYDLVDASGRGRFGADDLTVSGATKIAHPPVISPSAQILQFPPVVAVGGATIPIGFKNTKIFRHMIGR